MAAKNSTIVRTCRRFVQRGPRAAFWLLERAAPGVGAWWAERLWFRVPQMTDAARPHPPGGAPFEVEVDGRRLRGRRWGGGDPVYLVHGWGGAAPQLGAFVAPLVRAGFSVVSFDHPSHGLSDPGPSGPHSSNVLEFAAALRAVAARYGPARGVVGHSIGATAVAVALRDGLVASRAVFIAPMAHPLPYTYAFAARLGFGERTRARLARRVERRVGEPMSYFDVPAMARQARMPEVLVVHDKADRETSWSGGRDIAAAWPGPELVTTSRLGHRRILRDPEVVERVVGFLREAAPSRIRAAEEVAS